MWHEVHPEGGRPKGRAGHAAVNFDTDMLVFGCASNFFFGIYIIVLYLSGKNMNGYLNDTWVMDVVSNFFDLFKTTNFYSGVTRSEKRGFL